MIDLDSIKRVLMLHDQLGFDFTKPGLRCSCGEVLQVPRTWKPNEVSEEDWDLMDEEEKEEARSGARGYERLEAAGTAYLDHRARALVELVEAEV